MPAIVSDGSGGAIITWADYRSGNADIYAQKVNTDGSLGLGSGSISGAVYEQDGTTLVSSSITISAYDWNTDTLVNSTATSNGSYTLAGLPAGDYKVGASGTDYVDEYFEEKTSLAQANRVRVTANQETSNIDFSLSRVDMVSPPPPAENAIFDDSDYSGAKVEFLNLTTSFEVYIILSDKNPGSGIQGFKLGDYYDVVTIDPITKERFDYTGSVTITLPAGKKQNPQLRHWELVDAATGTWDWVKVQPITKNPDGTISGTVSSLSWFTVAGESAAEEGGCFIATAAYGSYLDSHVETLRNFRDSYMVTNPVGSALVSVYYDISPPVAEFIDDHPTLKPIVRAALLPAVAMSAVAVNTTSAEKAAIAVALLLVSAMAVVWVRRRTVLR